MEPAEGVDHRTHDDLSQGRKDHRLHAAQPRHEQDVAGDEHHGKGSSKQDPARRGEQILKGKDERVFYDHGDDQQGDPADDEIDHGRQKRRADQSAQLSIDAGLHGHPHAAGESKQR